MKDLEEAESWLDAAKFTLANTAKGRARFTVAIAQSIHASSRPTTRSACVFSAADLHDMRTLRSRLGG